MPKKGTVADPGLSVIAPGRGVIRCPPLSVCHQVSEIGHLYSPKYYIWIKEKQVNEIIIFYLQH